MKLALSIFFLVLLLFSSITNAYNLETKYGHLSTEKITSLANNGNIVAQQELGDRYYWGYYFNDYRKTIHTKNVPLGVKWHIKAANQGNLSSQGVLGYYYQKRYERDPQKNISDYKNAHKWFNKAYEKDKSTKPRLLRLKNIYAKNPPKQTINQPQKVASNSRNGHSHGGRTHTHPLPRQGINHRHGNGALGITQPEGTDDTLLQSKNHLLNNGFVSIKNLKIPKDWAHFIRDQNNCIHLNYSPTKGVAETVKWTGGCKNGFAYGTGIRTWYENGKPSLKKNKSISGKYTGLGKRLTLDDVTRAYGKYSSTQKLAQRKIEQHQRKKINERKDKIRKQKQLIIDKDLINFAKKYEFNSLIKSSTDVSASWYPSDDAKSNLGVNGKGTIKLYLKRSYTANAKITGKFKNGRLIGNAKLKVYASKCYKRGWILCKVSKDDSSTTTITASSNIKKYVNDAIDNMLPGMYRRASREIARLNSSSSSYNASSNSSYCSDGDTCYTRMEKRSGSYYFNCTKGSNKVGNKCVSYDPDPNIKHPYGDCGVPYSYRYKTLHEAANANCR